MFSFSVTKEISEIVSKPERTPVILSSTFLFKSPFSYPKITSLDLILSAVPMPVTIPSQPKN